MDGKKPYLAVVVVQTIYAGMFLLSKAAFDEGMNTFIFVFYRQAAATVFLVPFAIFLERKTAPPLSFLILLKIFMLSLIGITMSLNIHGIALKYTSASLAAATTNNLPVITFFFALILGMEKVKLRTRAGFVKLLGIALCLAGAAIIAFYKGPNLRLLVHHHLFNNYHGQTHQDHASSTKTWTKGVFLMLVSNCSWGLWLVLQVPFLKIYPSKLVSTTLQCFLSTIQSFVIAIVVERDPYEWKLALNLRLLAVAYCGIVVTGVTFYIQAWVIEKKGPVFLAMTTPLALVITIFLSAFLLGEIISLGSVLGGIVLVGGLYSVLWGKTVERKVNSKISTIDDEEAEGKHTESTERTIIENLTP